MFARLLAFLATLFAPLGHAATAAVSGLRSAGHAASSAVREAIDMLWDDLLPARKAARVAGRGAAAVGRGAALAGAGTAIATGAAIEGTAGVVGRTLGAVLPTPPVTARSLADAAVAHDDARGRGPAAVPAVAQPPAAPLSPGLRWLAPERHGALVQQYAKLWLKKDREGLLALPPIHPSIVLWLSNLSESERRLVGHLPPCRLEAHILARDPRDRNAALPAVQGYIAELRPQLTLEEQLHRAGYTPEQARPYLEREAAQAAADDAQERKWRARQEQEATTAPTPVPPLPPLRPALGR